MSDSCHYCYDDGTCFLRESLTESFLCEGPEYCAMYEPRDLERGTSPQTGCVSDREGD